MQETCSMLRTARRRVKVKNEEKKKKKKVPCLGRCASTEGSELILPY